LRRQWAIACTALVSGLVCVLSSCGQGEQTVQAGPLREPPKIAFVITATPGRVLTDGSVVLDLTGPASAKIIGVESLGGSGTLRFLGAKLASPHRRTTSTQWVPSWPPKNFAARSIVDAAGSIIHPASRTWHKQSYELLLGYRVLTANYATRTSVRVTYEVGGETYEATIPNILVTCPQHQNQTGCLKKGFAG
jgi:hypothetical protein